MDFRAAGCSLTGDPEQITASDVPNGLIYDASAVTLDEIRDGTTSTYLTTEKFICSDLYKAAGDGDQASMYAGVCGDERNSNYRSAGAYENAESPVSYLPSRDASSSAWHWANSRWSFGCALDLISAFRRPPWAISCSRRG